MINDLALSLEALAAQDVAWLQGVWLSTGLFDDEGNLQPLTADDPAVFTLTFTDNSLQAAGKQGNVTASYEVDPRQRPKTLDATRIVRVTPLHFAGIYELDGDRLRFCLAGPGEERPVTFRKTPQVEFAAEFIKHW
jgi:uncharacterized protein (TIGR03067 family)